MLVLVGLVVTGCTGSSGSGTGDRGAAADAALVPMPAVSDPGSGRLEPDSEFTRSTPMSVPRVDVGVRSVAAIDSDGQLAIIRAGVVRNDWFKFDAFPSPDRTTAVMTLGQEIGGIGPERPVMWASLPDGEPIGEQMMQSASELTATSLDGTFAGFTTRAGVPIDGALAGTRRTSEIEIISRDDGTVFRQQLEGNFEPEAFSDRVTEAGVPALVFLLEYVPADVPRFYRVRVLSTETGDVSLPLNLRNKAEQIDERMAGFTRSQVVAEEHGLLFTLYRGTIDGTPDGEPYAFVHTLDFADGVWCLEVDPRLELDRLPGSLAVGGDRLYVASANGVVGSYPIPALGDPNLSPTMDWVVDAIAPAGEAPVVTADDTAIYLADPERAGFVAHVHHTGLPHPAVRMFGGTPTAFDRHDGVLHAVGDSVASFGAFDRPDWLDEIEVLVVGS